MTDKPDPAAVPFDVEWYAVKDSESYWSLRCKMDTPLQEQQEHWLAHELSQPIVERIVADHNSGLNRRAPAEKYQVHPASDSDRGDTGLPEQERMDAARWKMIEYLWFCGLTTLDCSDEGYFTVYCEHAEAQDVAEKGRTQGEVIDSLLRQARMAESHEHAGEQEVTHHPQAGVLSALSRPSVSPAPDKALPELDRGDAVNLAGNAAERYGTGVTAKGVYMLAQAVLAMDEHIIALRQQAEELKEYGCHAYNQGFRDGISAGVKRAEQAESALTAERQKNEGLARDAERYRGQRRREWKAERYKGSLTEREWNATYDAKCDLQAKVEAA